jgi:ATP-dependent Lon protease
MKASNLKKPPIIIKNPENIIIKSELVDDNNEKKNVQTFMIKKCKDVENMILETYHFLESIRQYDIYSNHSITQCVDLLHDLHEKTAILLRKSNVQTDDEKLLGDLQFLYDKLLIIFTNYGTSLLKNVIYVVFGSKYNILQLESSSDLQKAKCEILEKYITPIGLKTVTWKESNDSLVQGNKITDQIIKPEEQPHLECILPSGSYTSLHQNVYGLRIIFRNDKANRIVTINGLIKNIPIQFIKSNLYINTRINDIITAYDKSDKSLSRGVFERWVDSLTIKELLIYSVSDLMKLFNSIQNDVNYVKHTTVDKIIKYFFDMDLICRRKMLVNLLLYNIENEVQYIAYMLYDLLGSSDACDGSDTHEQRKIYESLSWMLKQYFKETMVNTIEFTQDSISSGDDTTATLEQKVLLLRANTKVRDKAMAKLKEVKGKSDDQASKSKQYLEGLVKIPFGNYRKEPILCKIDELNSTFKGVHSECKDLDDKTKYTLYEMTHHTNHMCKTIENILNSEMQAKIAKMKKGELQLILECFTKECPANKSNIILAINTYMSNAEKNELLGLYEKYVQCHSQLPFYRTALNVHKEIKGVETEMKQINEYLDDSIYGHEDAKKQILKIAGQWINGEQKGYCFGFEGSPGVGKTSLAKRGLSNCLRDKDGSSRPFSFIALGGSCNGSTLEGHNYTYVNSTWGKIADVLMECKCMNPIIYIDELDKVSRTEQGREIIGILTHLIDTTQNDEFQDRYFSGVPIDLSKVLFIFSYNDPSLIDRVLLDRIHRVRFDNLSWSDKLVIVNKFMMPELNEKMGFENTVKLSDEVIRHIIDLYTMEPGVRKLKEILFDLFGEINLRLLNYEKDDDEVIELPIDVTIEELGTKYLKKYRKINETKIHKEPRSGIINGMWANALGKGGIIPIEVHRFPTSIFLDLRLTGMQGDVMKESMNVAKTIAWSLLDKKRQKKLLKDFEDTKLQGIHIHCPEGAVPKDGPSAGGAITMAIYSLLSDKQIHNEISMTGEMNLQGCITAIGGLDCKILGSIRAGVKKIIFPVENQEDFDEFNKKYKDVLDLSQMSFHPVNHINEAIKIAIDNK